MASRVRRRWAGSCYPATTKIPSRHRASLERASHVLSKGPGVWIPHPPTASLGGEKHQLGHWRRPGRNVRLYRSYHSSDTPDIVISSGMSGRGVTENSRSSRFSLAGHQMTNSCAISLAVLRGGDGQQRVLHLSPRTRNTSGHPGTPGIAKAGLDGYAASVTLKS